MEPAGPGRVERRLAAILAADVAGYSRLMGADEEGTLERLKAHRREIVDPKIKEHRGRIVKTTGDGLLVEFASVVDAVRCAAEIQRAMIDRTAGTPENKRITLRIGINLGDVIIDGDDIYGDGVNIAARLEALAEPGGICVARTVRNQVRDRLPYPFEDMGEQSVKNIARPIRADAMSAAAVASTSLVPVPAQSDPAPRRLSLRPAMIVASAAAVIGLGTAVWSTWPHRNSPSVPTQAPATESLQTTPVIAGIPAPRLSIVVLPFANLSDDREQEYFADGVTDDLTTDLSHISGSFVIARTTAFTYKGKAIDAKQIGHDLGVRYVLEGSVRRLGERLQVNVQLIDAESGGHVWADRFDTDPRDLAEADKAITSRLARSLRLEIVQAAARRLDEEAAGDLGAQDLILRARALGMRPFSRSNREAALQAWERALDADPRSTDPRIAIAGILTANVGDGFSNSVSQDLARAEQLLLESLEREPNQSAAHQVMGWLRRFQNRPAEAMAEYETAIALDPNNVAAIRQIGQLLRAMGEPEAAIPYLEKSLRLDPRGLGAFAAYNNLGICHLMLGHLDEAEEFFIRARGANPRAWFVHLGLGVVLAAKGEIDQARGAISESLRLNPEINSIARWRAYNARGQGAGNPKFEDFRNIVEAGLRRAGFPDE